MSKRKVSTAADGDADATATAAPIDPSEAQPGTSGITLERARRNRAKNRAVALRAAAQYAHYDPNAEPVRRGRWGPDDEEESVPRKSMEMPCKVVDWSPSWEQMEERRQQELLEENTKRPPRLFDLCCKVVSEHIEELEYLPRYVPDDAKVEMLKRLHKLEAITAQAVEVILATGLEAPKLFIPNCCKITDENLKTILLKQPLDTLKALDLGSCGRAFTDCCMESIRLPNLRRLRLEGGYLFTDKGMVPLLASIKELETMILIECCNITHLTLDALSSSHLRELSLRNCGELDGGKIVPALLRMTALTSLSLCEIPSVTDEVVKELVQQLGPALQVLTISSCRIGDAGVEAIASCCTRLETLDLSDNTELTASALTNLRSCKTLGDLSLENCDFGDETDDELASFLSAPEISLHRLSLNRVAKAGDITLVALAEHSYHTLEFLNVSFCRQITVDGLGILADSCKSLAEIVLFGCSQVTSKFVYGHSNRSLKLTGLSPASSKWPPPADQDEDERDQHADDAAMDLD